MPPGPCCGQLKTRSVSLKPRTVPILGAPELENRSDAAPSWTLLWLPVVSMDSTLKSNLSVGLPLDLPRRRAVGGGDCRQDPASLAARPGKAPGAERAVGGHGNAVLLAPRDHRVLDRTLLQVIEHLIAGDTAGTRDSPSDLEVGHIKVAQSPGENLPLALELFECRYRVLERVLA